MGEGPGTHKGVKIFKRIGMKYNPDMVILQYYPYDWLSDKALEIARDRWEKYKKEKYVPPNKIKVLLGKTESDITKSAILREWTIREYYNTTKDWHKIKNWKEEWSKWVRNPLSELINISQRENIKIVVIAWDRKKGRKGHSEILEEFLKERDVKFYDFSTFLPLYSEKIRLPDSHLNKVGYEIVANETIKKLLYGFEGSDVDIFLK